MISENEKLIQEYVSYLLEVATDSGWISNAKTNFARNELTLTLTKDLKNRGNVSSTLLYMKKNNITEIAKFYEIYEEKNATEKRNQNISKNQWELFLPFNVDFKLKQKILPTITVLDQKLFFKNEQYFLKKTKKNSSKNFTVDTQIKLTLQKAKTQNYIYAKITAKSCKAAWDTLEPALNTFRGLLEYTYGCYSQHYSSGETPRRMVSHPSWIVMQNNDEIHFNNFEIDDKQYESSKSINNESFMIFKRNAKLFQKVPLKNSIVSLIVDCLRIYCQALDSRFSYSCFLGLWQLAESITLSELSGGKTSIVVDRLAWHYKKLNLLGTGFKKTLTLLSKKRNDIVHHGIHDVDDQNVNDLKLICDFAILWLFHVRKKIPTKSHLREFYKLKDSNNSNLDVLSDCINMVKHTRFT